MNNILRTRRDVASLLLRTAVLFIVANVVFAAVDPMPQVSRLSLYNGVFPGRDRLPFLGVEGVFSPTTYDIDAMFASHRIAVPPTSDEFRVVLIGDSTVRGAGLSSAETYAGRLDAARLRAPDGRRMRFYSLGIVRSNVLRDALVIENARRFKPDLILWFVCMQTLNGKNLFGHELVRTNQPAVQRFADRHAVHIDGLSVQQETWLDRTIIGRRNRLKQIIDLQISGVMWTISGLETSMNFATLAPPAVRPDPLLRWAGYAPPTLPEDALRFDLMAAVLNDAGATPVIIVNEPIRLFDEAGSALRYNSSYPRWAYDEYRRRLTRFVADSATPLVDIWNLVPAEELIDNLHPWPTGTQRVGDRLAQELIDRIGATRAP